MRKQLVKLVACLTLISILFPVTNCSQISRSDSELKSNIDILKKGWIKEENDVKVMFLNGTHYEMGYQHGYFLKEEIRQNLRAFS